MASKPDALPHQDHDRCLSNSASIAALGGLTGPHSSGSNNDQLRLAQELVSPALAGSYCHSQPATYQQPQQWNGSILTDTTTAVAAPSTPGGMVEPDASNSTLSLLMLLNGPESSAAAPSAAVPCTGSDITASPTPMNHDAALQPEILPQQHQQPQMQTAQDQEPNMVSNLHNPAPQRADGHVDPSSTTPNNQHEMLSLLLSGTGPAPLCGSSAAVAAVHSPVAEGSIRLPSIDSSTTAFTTSTMAFSVMQAASNGPHHPPAMQAGTDSGHTVQWGTQEKGGGAPTVQDPHQDLSQAGERKELGSVNTGPPGQSFSSLAASFMPPGIDPSFLSSLEAKLVGGGAGGGSRGSADLAAVMEALMAMQQQQQLQQEQQQLQQQQSQYGLHLQHDNPHQQHHHQQQQYSQAHLHLPQHGQQHLHNGYAHVQQQHTNIHQQNMPYQLHNTQSSYSHLPQQQQQNLHLYNLHQQQQQLYQQQQQQPQPHMFAGAPLHLASMGQSQDLHSQPAPIALNTNLFPNPHASFSHMQHGQQHNQQQLNQPHINQQWSGLSLTNTPFYPNPHASFPNIQQQGQQSQPNMQQHNQLHVNLQHQPQITQQNQQQGVWGGLHLSNPPSLSQQAPQHGNSVCGNGVGGTALSLSVSHSPALLAAGAAAAAAPHRGPKAGRIYREVSAMQTAALAWLGHRAESAAAAAAATSTLAHNNSNHHSNNSIHGDYDPLGALLLGDGNNSREFFPNNNNGNGMGQGSGFDPQAGQGMGVGALHLSRNYSGPDGSNGALTGAAMRMNVIAQYNNRARVRDRGERAQTQLQRLGVRIEARQSALVGGSAGSGAASKLSLGGGSKAGQTRAAAGSSGSWLSLDLRKPDVNLNIDVLNVNASNGNLNGLDIKQNPDGSNDNNGRFGDTGAEDPVDPEAGQEVLLGNNGSSNGQGLSTMAAASTKWQQNEQPGNPTINNSTTTNNNMSTTESVRASLLQSDAVRSLVRRGVRGAASYEGRCKGRRGLHAALTYRSGLQQHVQAQPQAQSQPPPACMGAGQAVAGGVCSQNKLVHVVTDTSGAMEIDQAGDVPTGSDPADDSAAVVTRGSRPTDGHFDDVSENPGSLGGRTGLADLFVKSGSAANMSVGYLQAPQGLTPPGSMFPSNQTVTHSRNGSLPGGGQGSRSAAAPGTKMESVVAKGTAALAEKLMGRQRANASTMAAMSAARRKQEQFGGGGSGMQVDSAEEDDAEARAIVLIAQRAAERRRITAAAAAVIAARNALAAAAKLAEEAERGQAPDAVPDAAEGDKAATITACQQPRDESGEAGVEGEGEAQQLLADEERATGGDGAALEGEEFGSEGVLARQPTREQQLQRQLAQQAQQRGVQQELSKSSWEQLGQVHLQQQRQQVHQKLKGHGQAGSDAPRLSTPLTSSPQLQQQRQEQQPQQQRRSTEPGHRYQQLVQRKRQSGGQPPRQRQGGRYCSASVSTGAAAAAAPTARKGGYLPARQSSGNVREGDDRDEAVEKECREAGAFAALDMALAADFGPGGRWPVKRQCSEGWRFRRAVGPDILKGICVELGFMESGDSLLLPGGPGNFKGSSIRADPDHPWHPLNEHAVQAGLSSPHANSSPTVCKVPMLQRMRDLEAHTRRKHRGKGLLSLIQEAHVNLAAKLASSQRPPNLRQQPSPVLHQAFKQAPAASSRPSAPLPSKVPLHRKGVVGRPRLVRPEDLPLPGSASPSDHWPRPSSSSLHSHSLTHDTAGNLAHLKSRGSLSGSGSQPLLGELEPPRDGDNDNGRGLKTSRDAEFGEAVQQQQGLGEGGGSRPRRQRSSQQPYRDEDRSDQEEEDKEASREGSRQRPVERRRTSEGGSLGGARSAVAGLGRKSTGHSNGTSLDGAAPPFRSSRPSLDPGHDHPGSARSFHQKTLAQNVNSQSLNSWPAAFAAAPERLDTLLPVGGKHGAPVLHKLGHRQQQQPRQRTTLTNPPAKRPTNADSNMLSRPAAAARSGSLQPLYSNLESVTDSIAAAAAAAEAKLEGQEGATTGGGSQQQQDLPLSAAEVHSGEGEGSDGGVLARSRAALKQRLVGHLEPEADGDVSVGGEGEEARASQLGRQGSALGGLLVASEPSDQQPQKRTRGSDGGSQSAGGGGSGTADALSVAAAAVAAGGTAETAVTAAVGSLNRRKKAAPSRAAN